MVQPSAMRQVQLEVPRVRKLHLRILLKPDLGVVIDKYACEIKILKI